MNLVRMAANRYKPDFLSACTLYASIEPCPMCAGTIYWGNIGRVVFALGEDQFYEMIGKTSWGVFNVPCREILNRGTKKIAVIGPLLDEEALEAHSGFW